MNFPAASRINDHGLPLGSASMNGGHVLPIFFASFNLGRNASDFDLIFANRLLLVPQFGQQSFNLCIYYV